MKERLSDKLKRKSIEIPITVVENANPVVATVLGAASYEAYSTDHKVSGTIFAATSLTLLGKDYFQKKRDKTEAFNNGVQVGKSLKDLESQLEKNEGNLYKSLDGKTTISDPQELFNEFESFPRTATRLILIVRNTEKDQRSLTKDEAETLRKLQVMRKLLPHEEAKLCEFGKETLEKADFLVSDYEKDFRDKNRKED